MAWVCRNSSSLMEQVDLGVALSLEKELCPFNLAPTTSSVIQLAFGNVMAVACMQKKSFGKKEYLSNHPAGQIGVQLKLRVEDVMLKEGSLPVVKAEDLLMTAIVELTNKKCGCLLVINDDQEVQGVFTDGDLRRALQLHQGDVLHQPMKNLMNPSFISIEKQQLAIDAIKQMQNFRLIKEAPVVEGGKLIGLIRMHDIVARGIG